MTNPDNVGGLPELPEPVSSIELAVWGPKPDYFTADQMRAYGELCLAAPAGGDAVRDALAGQTIYLMGREHINEERKPLAELVYGMTVPGTGVLFCLADTEASMPVDTTTGQTSEARDAVVTDAMVMAALDAQPLTDENESWRIWQIIGFDDARAKKIMRSALVAAMEASR